MTVDNPNSTISQGPAPTPGEAEAKKAITRNTLTKPQSWRLCCYIDSEKAAFLKQQMNKAEVARVAAATLGFPITVGNVESALDAIGVVWPTTKAPSSAKSQLNQLRRDVNDLAFYLRAYVANGGLVVPPRLTELAGLSDLQPAALCFEQPAPQQAAVPAPAPGPLPPPMEYDSGWDLDPEQGEAPLEA